MLSLQESFNNVKIVCHNALMKREEWVAIEESLANIAQALQQYEVLQEKKTQLEKAAKEEIKKPVLPAVKPALPIRFEQPSEEPDEKT